MDINQQTVQNSRCLNTDSPVLGAWPWIRVGGFRRNPTVFSSGGKKTNNWENEICQHETKTDTFFLSPMQMYCANVCLCKLPFYVDQIQTTFDQFLMDKINSWVIYFSLNILPFHADLQCVIWYKFVGQCIKPHQVLSRSFRLVTDRNWMAWKHYS